jgi:hypothetical protein
MAYCAWTNSRPISQTDAVRRKEMYWCPFDRGALLRLKQTADVPAFHAAVKQVASRLLSQGGIQLFHKGGLVIASRPVRVELDSTYAQLVEGVVLQLMTYGVAFVCISGGTSFGDDDDDSASGAGGTLSTTDTKSVSDVVRSIRWNGGSSGGTGERVSGYTTHKNVQKPRPFLLDILNTHVQVEYMAHPFKPPDFRVTTPDLNGGGARLVMDGVVVLCTETPSGTTGISSAANRFMPTAVLGEIARSAASFAMQRMANPVVYTQEVSGKSSLVDDNHDTHAIGDRYQVEQRRAAEAGAMAADSVPLEARVAQQKDGDAPRVPASILVEEPLGSIHWTLQHATQDARVSHAPLHLMNNWQMVGPTCAVTSGRQIVGGPEAKMPVNLRDVHETLINDASLATLVPANAFSPQATATAVEVENRSFSNVVARYGKAVSAMLSLIINELYPVVDDLTSKAGGTKRMRDDSSETGDTEPIVVSFSEFQMPEMVFRLYESGFMGPEDAAHYLSHATGIPVEDFTKPPATLDPHTKGLVSTAAPEAAEEGGAPKRRRLSAPGAESIRNETAEAFEKKRGGGE